jgi:hypothetical protein
MHIVLCQNLESGEYREFKGDFEKVKAAAVAWGGEDVQICCAYPPLPRGFKEVK